MKKSTIAGLSAILLLIIMPAISAALNLTPLSDTRDIIKPLFDSVKAGKIHTVEIIGPNARPTMISIDKSPYPYVMLRTVTDSLSETDGKLVIGLGDPSALFQGTLRIPGLKRIIYRQTDILRN